MTAMQPIDQLELYVLGELPDAERAAVAEWLDADPARAEVLADARQTVAQVAAALAAPGQTELFTQRVLAALPAEPAPPERAPRRRQRAWPFRLIARPAVAAGLLAAACLALVATGWWYHAHRPSHSPPPTSGAVALAGGWRCQATGSAGYRVVRPDLVRLDHGELLVESSPLADGSAARPTLNLQTPWATATAHGTRFYIATYGGGGAAPADPAPRLTRVLVLEGTVTLRNERGSAAGPPGSLLVAAADQAPLVYALARNPGAAGTNGAPFALYAQLAKEEEDRNVCLAPAAVFDALRLVAEGAQGQTAAEFARLLQPLDAAGRIGDEAQVLPAVAAQVQHGLTALRGLPSDQFALANALWCDQTCPVSSAFAEHVREPGGAGAAFSLDLRGDPAAAWSRMSAWTAAQTGDRVRNLAALASRANARPADASLVLTSAACFRAQWAQPWAAADAKDSAFTRADGEQVPTPMLRARAAGAARYGAFQGDGTPFHTPDQVLRDKPDDQGLYPGDDGWAVAELPCQGGALALVVIVPRAAEGLPALEQRLTAANLSAWLAQTQAREVEVLLPRFHLERGYDLSRPLQALGLQRVFRPAASAVGAQLGAMTASADPRQQPHLSRVLHQVVLDLGADVTAALPAPAAPPAADRLTVPFTPVFRADRPFVFLVRDRQSGAILFLGRVVSP